MPCSGKVKSVYFVPCFAAVASSFINSMRSNRPRIHSAGVRYVNFTAQITNSQTDASQRGDREIITLAGKNLDCMLYNRKFILYKNEFYNSDSLVVLPMSSYQQLSGNQLICSG